MARASTNPSKHLTCYSVRAPKFKNQEVTVTNQFKEGEDQHLSVRKPYRLCVPSYKQVITRI